jgi:ubiquinone/menaquinone biosynthesis C-methylase UbiE
MQIVKQFLKEIQYKDSRGYDDRIAIAKYAVNPFDPWQWKAKHYDFNSATNILEVGCGTGIFWQFAKPKLSSNQFLTLTDFSQGMLDVTKKNLSAFALPCDTQFEIADVESLPYPDSKFDVVLAHFMLYHAQSQIKALSEISRVLKPTGWVGISTLCLNSHRELFQLTHEIDSRIPLDKPLFSPFSAEVADEMLPQFFPKINKHFIEKTLEIKDYKLIINYFKTHPLAQLLELKNDFFQELKRRTVKFLYERKKFVFKFVMVLYICSYER